MHEAAISLLLVMLVDAGHTGEQRLLLAARERSEALVWAFQKAGDCQVLGVRCRRVGVTDGFGTEIRAWRGR